MTVYEVTSAATSILGLLAVISSILLVRRQLGVMSVQTARFIESLQISAETAIDAQLLFVSQAYIDHPELRAVFNERELAENPEPLDPQLRLRANALAEVLLDSMERALSFEARDLQSAALMRPWTEDSLRGSSFLRAFLSEHRGWYSPELIGVLDVTLAEIPTQTVPP